MYCKVAFIIYISQLGDSELDNLIDTINVLPGITEERLYYGLNKVLVDDDFKFSVFIHESLSSILYKGNLLKELKEKYNLFYELSVKFSDVEDDIMKIQSYILSDEINEFIKITDTYYNLDIKD